MEVAEVIVFPLADLPNEILERIAMELDSETLVYWKRTCSRFRAIVARMPSEQFWRHRCLAEIPTDVFIDIGSPTLSSEVIYVSWYVQRRLVDRRIGMSPTNATGDEASGLHEAIVPSPTVTKFDTWHLHGHTIFDFPRRFSGAGEFKPSAAATMKVSGDVVVTGHQSGRLIFWDVSDDVCKPIGDLALHQRRITDMILIDHYNRDFESKKRQPADHHHVLTVSMDNTVKTVSLHFDPDYDYQVFTYRPAVHVQLGQASVFSNLVAVSRSQGSVELLTMALVGERLELNSLQTIDFETRDSHSWISFWKYRLTVIRSNMDCYTVQKRPDASLSQWTCHPPMVIGELRATVDNPIVARWCQLFRGNIIVVRTMSRQMCLSIDGRNYRIYSTLKDLQGVVTSATVKGNLIALGTDYGSVYVYHFESDELLQALDLSKPVWSGQLKGARAITVLAMRLDPRGPVLVATDCESVFVVKWNLFG